MAFRHTTAYFNTLMAVGLLTAGLLFTSCEKMRIRKTKIHVQLLSSINSKPLPGVHIRLYRAGVLIFEVDDFKVTDKEGNATFIFGAKGPFTGDYTIDIAPIDGDLFAAEYNDYNPLKKNRLNRVIIWAVPKAYINYRFESLDPTVVDSVDVSTTSENGEKYGDHIFRMRSTDGSGYPYQKPGLAAGAAGYNFIHWKLYVSSGQVTDHYDTLYVDWMEQKDFQITY